MVLYNTGAIPIVVQNLRLRFVDQPKAAPLRWVATRSRIMPDGDEERDLAAVFYVGGRSAQQIFAEFGADSLGFELEQRSYPVHVEAKLGHKEGWTTLLSFTLQADRVEHPQQYITYSNDPDASTTE